LCVDCAALFRARARRGDAVTDSVTPARRAAALLAAVAHVLG
jgi:hypothetical protein